MHPGPCYHFETRGVKTCNLPLVREPRLGPRGARAHQFSPENSRTELQSRESLTSGHQYLQYS